MKKNMLFFVALFVCAVFGFMFMACNIGTGGGSGGDGGNGGGDNTTTTEE